MSHISTMASTTTPPVTVVSSGLSSVTVAPSLTGFRVSLDQQSGSTTTLDAEGLWRCSWFSFCATQANSIFISLLAYANYAIGSPQVGFFFRVDPPTISYIICLVSVLVSAFYF